MFDAYPQHDAQTPSSNAKLAPVLQFHRRPSIWPTCANSRRRLAPLPLNECSYGRGVRAVCARLQRSLFHDSAQLYIIHERVSAWESTKRTMTKRGTVVTDGKFPNSDHTVICAKVIVVVVQVSRTDHCIVRRELWLLLYVSPLTIYLHRQQCLP